MRFRSAGLLALLFAAAPLAAQPAPAQGEQLWDRVVAVVGDTSLLWSDVLIELEAMQAQGQPVPSDPAGREQVVRDVVRRRVDDLMMLEAARAAGTTVEAADVVTQVEAQINQVQTQFGSEAAFQEALRRSGRTMEQYRQSLTQQYIDQTLLQRYASQRLAEMTQPQVTEAELQAYFDANRERLGTRPATVSFQQAVVKPQPTDSAKAAARRKAEGILAEILRDGGDFEALARRHSEDPSAQQGGSLGWFRQGQMVREFDQMVFALRPGAVAPVVVETEFGYHIIKLDKVRGPERQARHILIRPQVTEDDVARARALADSLATAARAGAPMAELAQRAATPAEERTIRDAQEDRLPPAFSAALQGAQPGTVVGPFELPAAAGTSFVVAKLTQRQTAGAYTLDDVREQIRERVAQQKAVERMIEELRASTHVVVML
ncbi:MAG TPA: peptidylprolyl isomerase [Longimicrobium sp.]|nr:peptidylprolyl isomerase [Longimicrobium sp.]